MVNVALFHVCDLVICRNAVVPAIVGVVGRSSLSWSVRRVGCVLVVSIVIMMAPVAVAVAVVFAVPVVVAISIVIAVAVAVMVVTVALMVLFESVFEAFAVIESLQSLLSLLLD